MTLRVSACENLLFTLFSMVYVLCADVRVSNNWTPLHIACYNGHKDVVQYLVEKDNCFISEYNTTRVPYSVIRVSILVQVQFPMMAILLLTLLHSFVTLKLLTTSSLYSFLLQ